MEVFEFLKLLHDEAIRLSENITFDKKHPRQLHLVGLYGTLIELCGCLVTLIDQKFRTGVPPIFRAILEAYVEFKNLHMKAEYGYSMAASNHEQWLRVLREAKTKENPYLKGISDMNNLQEQIKHHEAKLMDLKQKGYIPLKIFHRFERAEMEKEYRSLYNFLSSASHSNIRALIDRHAEIHEDDFSVVYYKDEPLGSFLTYIDSTAGLLMDASKRIHDFFGTGFLEEVEKLDKQLNEIRSRY